VTNQIAFFDTSALLKRYIPSERGAEFVARILTDRDLQVVVSRIAGIEVASALARRAAEGTLSAPARNAAWGAFLEHVRDEYRVVAISEAVAARAEEVVTAVRARSLDAIQVATALVVAAEVDSDTPFVFYTADGRQAQAAAASGLQVEVV
jgi:predicted nucleic acid-binding protein